VRRGAGQPPDGRSAANAGGIPQRAAGAGRYFRNEPGRVAAILWLSGSSQHSLLHHFGAHAPFAGGAAQTAPPGAHHPKGSGAAHLRRARAALIAGAERAGVR